MASEAAKSSTFVWQGTDKRGQKTDGEMNSASMALVKAQLRKQGIAPTKVRKKQSSLFSGAKKEKNYARRHHPIYSPNGDHDESWRPTGSVL